MSTTDLVNQQPSTINQQPTTDSEVLVRVENVSKKFCRSLKKSLWYGVQDIAHELNPFYSHPPNKQQPTKHEERSTKNAFLRPDEFWAVNNVSFELRRGECLGLIGHNGAGKTTLLKMLNGLIKPDEGRIIMRGHVGALIALGSGFNPILTGRENAYINASVLGLTRRETNEKIDEIIDFAEIGEFIDMPVQSYSSGMQVRLGFAVATTIVPDILILDEVLAVGDATFRAKCFQRIGKLLHASAVIFVSHSEPQVQRICNRAVWLKKGMVQAIGDVQPILNEYRNEQSECDIKLGDWVTGEGVLSVEVPGLTRRIRTGDCIEFLVHIVCSKHVTISNLYCQWHIAGAGVAEALLPDLKLEPLGLNPGLNKLEISIDEVNLAKGDYEVSFAAFCGGGKETVAHCHCAIKVRIDGPLGVGPAAQLPGRARIQ